MKTYKVRFTVQYEATIQVVDGELVSDVVSDIDIPETDTCTYIAGSFEPQEPQEVRQ